MLIFAPSSNGDSCDVLYLAINFARDFRARDTGWLLRSVLRQTSDLLCERSGVEVDPLGVRNHHSVTVAELGLEKHRCNVLRMHK